MRVVRAVLVRAALACTLLGLTAPAAGAQELALAPLPLESLRTAAVEALFDTPQIQAPVATASLFDASQQIQVPRAQAPVFSEPRRPGALVPLYAGLVTLQALDFHSTRRALDLGAGQEANPLMKPVVGNNLAFAAVKASTAAGIIWATEKLWKNNRKAAVIVAGAANVLTGFIVARNYRIASEHQRWVPPQR
ncbi:MAG TPA: DUF5658 family protein [Vicinamibacterales bacterium]|nr:DUF5658 family protein [Vicinamibacterales bacterium]